MMTYFDNQRILSFICSHSFSFVGFHHKQFVRSCALLLICWSLCFCLVFTGMSRLCECWLAQRRLRPDVLCSPEWPISGCGAGPAPRELTAWTLISNGVYVPVLCTVKGGDRTWVEFQRASVTPASRHHTLYWKSWPLWKRLSISCKDTQEDEMHSGSNLARSATETQRLKDSHPRWRPESAALWTHCEHRWGFCLELEEEQGLVQSLC